VPPPRSWLSIFPLVAALVAFASPAEARPPRPPARLTILTINLRSNQDRPAEREPVIARFLRKTRPDVVLFQEVAPPGARQAERVLPAGYTVVARQNPDTGRGLAIASRFPIARSLDIVLPGRGRPALGAVLDLRGRPLSIVNVHLSPELGAVETRKRELARAVELLGELGGDGVLGGDFNFGDGAPEQAVLRGLVDAFRARHKRPKGYTWDILRNPLAKRNGYAAEPSRRLDRLMLRGKLRTLRADVVLNRPSRSKRGDVIFASDHFGLFIRVQLVAPKRRRR